MKRCVRTSTTIMVLLLLLPGCSKDESAPPPAIGCSEMPNNVACQRTNGECVPMRCTNASWECASSESVVALTPGRCTGPDASADGGNG